MFTVDVRSKSVRSKFPNRSAGTPLTSKAKFLQVQLPSAQRTGQCSTAIRLSARNMPARARNLATECFAAISGFRALDGCERRSWFSPRARHHLSRGTFHPVGLSAVRALASVRGDCGVGFLGPMLWSEPSRSRAIFQAVFIAPDGLAGPNFVPSQRAERPQDPSGAAAAPDLPP